MSFLNHLDELRGHLFRSVIAIVALFIIAFIFPNIIFEEILFGPLSADFPTYKLLCFVSQKIGVGDTFCINEINLALQNTAFLGKFLTHLKVSFVAGFIMAFPFIINEIWRFVKPALSKSEKLYARGLIFFCSFLFFTGVCFGYFVIAPFTINFVASYGAIDLVKDDIQLGSYIGFITSIVIAAGLMFEMPIFAYFFSKIGILSPDILKQYRKHAIVVMLVISAIVTPPDVFSQLLLSMPLYFLYEISILISARVNKNIDDD
jgi:sec-independent protein translocase protein TatC